MIEQGSSRFDLGAVSYDRRTGIPPSSCQEIARAAVRVSGAAQGDVLLELGAGTGQIGSWFPDTGVSYLGLDASEPMLAVFRERHSTQSEGLTLRRADVNEAWPIPEGSVRCVFSSRAVHLFDLEHVVAETVRVGLRDGVTLLVGRVERDPNSVRDRLRREKRAALARRGFAPTEGGARRRKVLELAQARGGQVLEPVVAATWTTRHSAAEIIRHFRETAGLGGATLPVETKEEILRELERWAESELGSLDRPQTSEDRFILEGARFVRPDPA
jgi:ubiquinone/menaquinone biosynthesis C-methylase UbiE